MKPINLLDIASGLARTVGQSIRSLSTQDPLGTETGTIGASGDKTKRADQQSVDEAKRYLANSSQNGGGYLLDEETGVSVFGDSSQENSFFVILDPIDGSNNLRPWLTPSPAVSVSVAVGFLSSLKDKSTFDAIEAGCVMDIFNNRLYFAARGEGSRVENFGPIHTSPNEAVEDTILGVDLDAQNDRYNRLMPALSALLTKVKCKRRLGSSILDFMKVACGEYDAFCSLAYRMKLHDVAAAKLIVEESGGIFELNSQQSSDELLKTLLETKDKNLLKTNTFSVIASGNRTLHRKIKTELRQ